MEQNKMTPTPWKINHWEPSDGSGVTCIGQMDGIWYYMGDGVTEKAYGIRSDVDPMEHNISASFEGAHIADIEDFVHRDGGLESRANAIAIVSAVNNTYGAGINPESVPELLRTFQNLVGYFDRLFSDPKFTPYQEAKAAIEKATIK